MMKNKLNKFLAVWLCVVMVATGFFAAIDISSNAQSSSDEGMTDESHPSFSDGFDYPVGKPDGVGYGVEGYGGLAFLDLYDYQNDNYPEYHPGEDWNDDNTGCDWGGDSNDAGDPVYAISNGFVRYAQFRDSNWGYLVLIEHVAPLKIGFILPDGRQLDRVWSLYGHLANIDTNVEADKPIKRGQQIGTIGDYPHGSGKAYHLHFEIRIIYRDPWAWVSNTGKDVTDYQPWPKSKVQGYYTDPSNFIELNRQVPSRLDPVWCKTWGDYADRAYSVAVDNSNIYVAGHTVSYDYDVFILKYDLNGNFLWHKTWGGSNNDFVYSIAVDNSNIYVAGGTESFGAGSKDAFILKYDLDGNLLWYKTWGGANDDFAFSIAVDSSNIYVTGYTESFSASPYDTLILKYDLNGNLLWYKTWGGSSKDYARSIAVDNSNIYVAGSTNSFSASPCDTLILKYDLNGNLLWYKTWGGSGSDTARSIAVDSSNIYVAGYRSGPDYGKPGGDRNVNTFVLKYDLNGNLIWGKEWGGLDRLYSDDRAVSIAVDSSNIYVAGYTNSYRAGGDDALILKYDLDGHLLWYKIWGGSSLEVADSIAVDSSNIFVAGFTRSYGGAFVLKTDLEGGSGPAGEPGIPDLSVSSEDISWNVDYLIEGETVELTATIHNIGTVSATATIEFYICSVGPIPDRLVGQDNVIVPPSEMATASIKWDVDAIIPTFYSPKKAIFVKIVDSTPTESNLENNKASKPISINNWGWGRIDADKTLEECTGKEIVVAIIDSGVDYKNKDFGSDNNGDGIADGIWINIFEDINNNGKFDNWLWNEQREGVYGDLDGEDNDGNGYTDDVIGWDFDGLTPFHLYPGDNDPSPDSSDEMCEHGTHVAGILGARAYDNYGIIGVAPEAKIMNIRVNFSNFQKLAELWAAIRYAADNGADIISMSWGSPVDPTNDIRSAMNYAYSKGCILVACAGNHNTSVVDMPARYHNVLAVAATDKNDQRWEGGWFEGSNYGWDIDISAPGVDIWSDIPGGPGGGIMKNDTGTSMATPFVSGVAALVLEANEKLKRHPDVVYALLKDTATPLSDKEWDLIPDSWEYGAGLVNAKNAVDHAGDSWDSFNLACPANLSVYDSEGRHVGLNATGGIDIEIPRAYYSGPGAEPETLVIFNSTGDLTIDVIGNSTGVYNLTMESYDGEGIKTFEIWDSELTNKTIDSIILKEGRNTVIIKTNEDEKTYSLNITKKTLNETATFTLTNMTIKSDEYHSYDVLNWGNLTTANNTVILNITETGPGAINSTINLTNGMNGTVVEHNIKEFKIKYMMNETVELMQTLDEMDMDQEAKDDLNNTLTGVLLHLATALYYHTDPDLPDNVSVPQRNDTCDRHLILARFMLCEFIKQVEGYRDQDRISNSDANILVGDANTTIEQITRILEDGGPGPKPVDDDSPPLTTSLLNFNMFFVNNIFILLIIAIIGILMTAYPYYREIRIDGDCEMYRKLGELSFRYGSNKTAIEHFKKAIWLNSNDAVTWNDIGVVLRNKGKCRSALKCYDNAIKLNQNYGRAWYNKGCALSQIGDYYRAFDCFNKVVELNAENLGAGNMRDEALERVINVMNN